MAIPMDEALAFLFVAYLELVEVTYAAKTWNLYKDIRDGIVYKRRLDNPCEHAHAVASDVRIRALPFPFEYACLINEYMKDYKRDFPDSSAMERFRSFWRNCGDRKDKNCGTLETD